MGVKRYSGDRFALFEGDCLDVLATLPAASVDAIVTDPPYGLGFMGKNWDHGIPGKPFWTAALRVAKPGVHLLAFGGTRTFHRLAVAIEDAGWEIRDTIMWVYGSGFPKSLNLEGDWKGWGTALKPAWEPIIVARKPLGGTVAQNVQQYGTGALNIDACRIGFENEADRQSAFPGGALTSHGKGSLAGPGSAQAHERTEFTAERPSGRWPANLIHDGSEEVTELFPESKDGVAVHRNGHGQIQGRATWKMRATASPDIGYGGSGSAARFFYCAKADGVDRDEGLEDLRALTRGEATNRVDGTPGINSPRAGAGRTRGGRNMHPTVKPIDLMQYLIRLVTPKGAIVLDPFMGSGSTGKAAIREGVRFIGIDLSDEYVGVAHLRILHELKRILARPMLDT